MIIETGNAYDIEKKKDEYDEIWYITRTLGNIDPGNMLNNEYHVSELSPSTNLFYQYLNYKKKGLWNKKTFDNEYKTKFMKEIDKSQAAQLRLIELYAKNNYFPDD